MSSKDNRDEPVKKAHAPTSEQDWFYSLDGKGTRGPVSFDQLAALARAGQLKPTSLVRRSSGMKEWVPAKQFKALWEPPSRTVAPKPTTAKDPTPREAAPRPAVKPTVAEVKATYQGGHPNFVESMAGVLRLDGTGVVFATNTPKEMIRIDFARVVDIREPRTGTFPDAMVKQSQTTRTAAQAGKFATGLAGSLLGGLAGRAVQGVGKAAAGAAHDATALGPLPKNRIVVVALVGKVRHEVFFDAVGTTKDQLEKAAREFWMGAAKVRGRFGKPSQPSPQKAPPPREASPARQADRTVAPHHAYRILKGGRVLGPLSGAEVNRLLTAGSLAPTDLVCVEAWIPAGTLVGLVGSTPSTGLPSTSTPRVGSTGGGGAPDGSPRPQGPSTDQALVAGGAVGLAAGLVAGTLVSRAFDGAPGSRDTMGRAIVAAADTDGDGRFDTVGVDSDGDGVLDVVGVDADGDGDIDVVGVDTDDDGDVDAVGIDTDDDGDVDAVGFDTDGDGDVDEIDLDFE